MKFASIVTFFVAFSGIGLGAASKAKSTYSFATGKSADGQQPTHKKTIRQRRAAEISSAKLVQPTSSTGKEHPLTNEDVEFWNRMLQSDMGSVAPTPPPTVGPCPVRVSIFAPSKAFAWLERCYIMYRNEARFSTFCLCSTSFYNP